MSTNPPMFSEATPTAPPRPMIVAEIGVNHDGSASRAAHLIDLAAQAGADAVKFQWFCPSSLLSNQARLARYQDGQANTAAQMLDRLALSFSQMQMLREHARSAGVGFIITAFSRENLPQLDDLDLDALKIASPDAVNTPLLEAATSLHRPLLISTGTCDLDELAPAASLLHNHAPGGGLLQCVSSYPTPAEEAALHGMTVMRQQFRLPVGYSDHTTQTITGALAIAAGALVLEKHLTHDRNAEGPDHAASLEPHAFAEYVDLARCAQQMLGPRVKNPRPIEHDVRDASRQSLCARRDLPAGHVLQETDLTIKRPGIALPAAQLNAILGRRLARSVQANNLLDPADLDVA